MLAKTTKVVWPALTVACELLTAPNAEILGCTQNHPGSGCFSNLLKSLEGNPILPLRELDAVRWRLRGEHACLPLQGRSHGTSPCLSLSYPKS
jgi:hypothetical protein